MAVESKPLFHPEVLRQELRSFKWPTRIADSKPKLQRWADLITSGGADDFTETDLLPDFIPDLFCHLLGYTRPAGPTDTFTLAREKHLKVDGQIADAMLGRFQASAGTGPVGVEEFSAWFVQPLIRA